MPHIDLPLGFSSHPEAFYGLYLGMQFLPSTGVVVPPPPPDVVISQVPYNVKDYGAVGDGVTDDRAAIQLAISAAWANGGGQILFPAGDYLCGVTAGIPVFGFVGAGQGNLLLRGCGRASRLIMSGNGANTDRRLMDIKNGALRVDFRNLCFRSDLTNSSPDSGGAQQQHLINWESSSGTDNITGYSTVEDCYFEHTRGDACRFLGGSGTVYRVQHVRFKRCVFQMGGATSRCSFSFQRQADDITIDSCYGDPNADSVHFEPTGLGSNDRMRIVNGLFEGIVTLSGNGLGTDSVVYEQTFSQFLRNTVINGMSALDVKRLVVTSCIVDFQAAGLIGSAVYFQERIHDVTVTKCIFNRKNDTGVPVTLDIDYHTVGQNRDIVIDGNLVIADNASTDGGGIVTHDINNCVISNNLVKVNIGTANKGFGIKQEATTEPSAVNTVRGNMCVGTNAVVKNGVVCGDGDASVCGNLLRHVQTGVSETPSASTVNTFAWNIIDASTAGISPSGISWATIDGVGGLSPSVVDLRVDPTAGAGVPAAVGSLGLRVTGGGAGTTLWKKETSGNTGWVSI